MAFEDLVQRGGCFGIALEGEAEGLTEFERGVGLRDLIDEFDQATLFGWVVESELTADGVGVEPARPLLGDADVWVGEEVGVDLYGSLSVMLCDPRVDRHSPCAAHPAFAEVGSVAVGEGNRPPKSGGELIEG
ncbi:MAG: hypothetical protein AAF160_19295 [Pseudomonadota bacterium]